MRKFGEVLDYRTADKAVVGKKYVFSNYLKDITEKELSDNLVGRPLLEIVNSSVPFKDSCCFWQFCREVIKEEERMTNRQLTEWLGRGNGQVCYGYLSNVYTYHNYKKGDDCRAVDNDNLIRSWGSDEWVKPTLEIYERDCKGN